MSMIVKVTCPWTNLVGRLKLHGHVDTSMWRWMSMGGIHLSVVRAHLINYQALFTELDKTKALGNDTLEVYFKWWYDEITALRPSLRPLIEHAQKQRSEYYPLTWSVCGAFRAHWNESRSNHVQTTSQ